MQQSISYGGKHTIVLDDKHQYKLDGKRVVGTTTFIKESLPTSRGLIQWEMGHALRKGWELGQANIILTDESIKTGIVEAVETGKKKSKEAALVGSCVHQYAEVFEKESPETAEKMKEEFKEKKDFEKILKGIEGFLRWKEGRKERPVHTEKVVAYVCPSCKNNQEHRLCLNYGGMFDRLSEVNGKLTLTDYKTSGGIYWDMFVQLGAYSNAIRQWDNLEVQALEIVRFDKETGEVEEMRLDVVQAAEEQALICRKTYEFQKWIKKQMKGDKE